jgi:hypothetical protein
VKNPSFFTLNARKKIRRWAWRPISSELISARCLFIATPPHRLAPSSRLGRRTSHQQVLHCANGCLDSIICGDAGVV